MLLTVIQISGFKSVWKQFQVNLWIFVEIWKKRRGQTSVERSAQAGGAASIPLVEVGGATSSLLSDNSRSQRKARPDQTCRKQRSPFFNFQPWQTVRLQQRLPKCRTHISLPPVFPLHSSQFKIFNWKMNITTMKKGHMHKFKTYKKYKRTVLLKSHFKYHFNNKNI